MRFNNIVPGLALAAGLVSAHPGHDISQEIAERRSFLQNVERSDLSHCAETLKARGVHERNVARRHATVEQARAKRGFLERRDIDDVLAKSHNKTEYGYTPITSPELLFGEYNSCLLTPEATQGPYYVGGEFIRENVVEEQAGIETILDFQVIDVDTCEPVPNVYFEIWHCNSTGVYSGVLAGGNGNQNDETNIDNTFLRGIQETNEDGVAQFTSLFPGHYTGRTTHIHVMVHTGATPFPNGTLGNEVTASHVGQTYFDQDLINLVEQEPVYVDNQQPLTTNAQDGIMRQGAEGELDPVMSYTLLNEAVADGLFAWIAFGINTTYSTEIEPAVFYYKEGGVTNPNGGGGGPGGPGGPPGNVTSE